ncbi:MAG: nucleotide exchange factor GrpE [Candidatus Nanoarchaeia archaeon]
MSEKEHKAEDKNHTCCGRGDGCCKESKEYDSEHNLHSKENHGKDNKECKGHKENKGQEGCCNNEEVMIKYGELKETVQRVYAEFQNYKKRTEEEKQKFAQLSTEDLIKRLLPLMDDFERALAHKKQEDEFSRGIEMIYKELVQIFEDEGARVILANGKFDPKLHEVILTEESDKAEGTILEELQKGYTLGGKVIRHSKVKISKQKNGATKENIGAQK